MILLKLSNLPRVVTNIKRKKWWSVTAQLVVDFVTARSTRQQQFEAFRGLSREEKQHELEMYCRAGIFHLVLNSIIA